MGHKESDQTNKQDPLYSEDSVLNFDLNLYLCPNLCVWMLQDARPVASLSLGCSHTLYMQKIISWDKSLKLYRHCGHKITKLFCHQNGQNSKDTNYCHQNGQNSKDITVIRMVKHPWILLSSEWKIIYGPLSPEWSNF